MTVKQGADITNIHPDLYKVLGILDGLWGLHFTLDTDGMTVTSGHEESSKHKDFSKHYIKNCKSGYGEAVDIRIKDVPQSEVFLIRSHLWELCKKRLITIKTFEEGVFTENAHLHIQL